MEMILLVLRAGQTIDLDSVSFVQTFLRMLWTPRVAVDSVLRRLARTYLS